LAALARIELGEPSTDGLGHVVADLRHGRPAELRQGGRRADRGR